MISGKIRKRLLHDNAGSVLILSIIFSMATIILGVAFLKFADFQRQQVTRDIMEYKAWSGAHAALIRGMALDPSPGGQYEASREHFYSDPDDEFSIDYQYSFGPAVYEDALYGSRSKFFAYGKAWVTTNEFSFEIEDTVRNDMSSTSYADWLYITDREHQSYRRLGDSTLYFWGGDTLDGKVHSNDMISFQMGNGDWPVFYYEVTTCSTRWNPTNAPQVVHFYGGQRTSAQYMYFPIAADSVRKYNGYPEPNLGVSPAHQADSITEIILQPTYFVVRHRSTAPPFGLRDSSHFPIGGDTPGGYDMDLETADTYSRYAYPPSKALFIEGELWLVGPKSRTHFNCPHPEETDGYMVYGFAGELTIAASGDIIIAQDVVYQSSNSDGSVPITSLDVLGIISEKHVLVWRNAPSVIKITAALGAIGYNIQNDTTNVTEKCHNSNLIPVDGIYGTISIDGINCYGWQNEKSQLTITGCLIQKERGLVHTHYTEGGYPEADRGYISKDYKYDHRFINHPPPHFFQTSKINKYYAEGEPKYSN